MAINYTEVGWDTSKYVNPTNMNQMDNGIKAACDGVDTINGGTITGGTIALTSDLLNFSSPTLLKEFNHTSESTVTLNADASDYDLILIDLINANGALFYSSIMNTSEFLTHASNTNPITLYVYNGASFITIYIKIISSTQISCFVSDGNYYARIKGIG